MSESNPLADDCHANCTKGTSVRRASLPCIQAGGSLNDHHVETLRVNGGLSIMYTSCCLLLLAGCLTSPHVHYQRRLLLSYRCNHKRRHVFILASHRNLGRDARLGRECHPHSRYHPSAAYRLAQQLERVRALVDGHVGAF